MSVAQYLTDIAEYLRFRLKNEQKYKLSQMTDGIHAVYETAYSEGEDMGYQVGYSYGTGEGYQNAIKEFWDEFQDNGNRKNYRNAFWFSCWTQKNYNPQHDFIVENGNEMFRYSLIENTVKTLDFSAAGTTSSRVFANVTKLKSIPSLVVSEAVTFSNWFEKPTSGDHPLENLGMSGVIGNPIDFKDCTALSAASIENVVDILSDTKEGIAVTFSQKAVNSGFSENEWNELIARKENWTFSLI